MAEERASDLVGQVVSGRYQVDGVLGRGGQGIVYRARDQRSGMAVALKVLNEPASRDPQIAGRFLREQAALQALSGTSAVRVYDAGETSDRNLFLALELLEGHDLEQEIDELKAHARPPTLERVAELMAPVTATLDAAHAQGILHRDLKPANIFVLRAGGVRLLDFGLARLRSWQPLTAVGSIMGSPSYIAPEMWLGKPELVDHRVDVYAVGVILFRLLSGERPFKAKDMIEALKMATTAPRPSLCALRPDLPSRLDPWVQRALAIDPAGRYQSAGQCIEQLFIALGTEAMLAEARARLEEQYGGTTSRVARVLAGTASALKRWASFSSKSPVEPAGDATQVTPPAELPRPELDDSPDSEAPVAQRGATLSRSREKP